MNDRDDLIKKRFLELARRADGYYLFSDFLGLAEQALFSEVRRQTDEKAVCAFGGVEGAERVMLRFGNPEVIGYDAPFPIVCLKAEPKNRKFADALTHRDFLGGLMSLGIEREVLGDIVIRDNVGYLFVKEEIAPFIAQSLTKVRHTDLKVSVADTLPEGELYRTEPCHIQLTSERLDAVIAKVFRLSREEAQGLFAKKLVFVGGAQCENTSHTPKPGDVISVRGYGRMIYREVLSQSKKGKLNLTVDLYV